jgi:multidrug efflux pump subunit AcrA (membrane-fusion protein)
MQRIPNSRGLRLGPWASALGGLAGLAVGASAAIVLHDRIFPAKPALAAPALAQTEPSAPPPKVTLPEGKRKTAGIETEPARREALPTEIVVAGTIEPNPTRRVDIRPRASAIVRTVNVQPSQNVKAGDILAMLESAEVATARLNVRARQLDLSIARTEDDWRTTIAANVEEMIPLLKKGTPAADLEKRFANKVLGIHRADLLSAYAAYEIDTHEEGKQAQLFHERIVGEHMPFVAQHTREASQAKFEAALEQVRWDASQQKRLADQQVRRAEAGLIDAVKRLEILGVHEGPPDPLAAAGNPYAATTAAEDITAYPLVAPFEGTILTTSVVPSQRVELTDILFTLADLRTVRVVANIPELDLPMLPLLSEGGVRVEAAAYPGRSFKAAMLYSAPMVDPMTRRVRLVAEAPNSEGLLRLGMFTNVLLESPSKDVALTVPASALVEIENKQAVFIALRDGQTFTLRYVITGREAAGRQAITGGLSEGEVVVKEGAFMLKSELILQNQPEED